VLEDPQSKLALSNNAHWAIVDGLRGMAPRYLVLGGGGYNPWSVGRLWTGVWGVLAGQEIPDRLPEAAQEVLRALRWEGAKRFAGPPADWVETLRDVPREGAIGAELRARVGALRERLMVQV
jgi:acetoin utilization protein AcuC